MLSSEASIRMHCTIEDYDREQVGQLSQANCAAPFISFGKNISAKSLHLTSLYPMALTSTNDHLTVLRHLCSIYALIMEVL